MANVSGSVRETRSSNYVLYSQILGNDLGLLDDQRDRLDSRLVVVELLRSLS